MLLDELEKVLDAEKKAALLLEKASASAESLRGQGEEKAAEVYEAEREKFKGDVTALEKKSEERVREFREREARAGSQRLVRLRAEFAKKKKAAVERAYGMLVGMEWLTRGKSAKK